MRVVLAAPDQAGDAGGAGTVLGDPVLDDVRLGDSGSALVQRGRLVGVVVLADTDGAQGFAVGGGDWSISWPGRRMLNNF